MLRVSASAIALLIVLVLAGCGGGEAPAANADAGATDDAFVVRIARHQQTALALARSASADADAASVRKLARAMADRREALLPALSERIARVPDQNTLPALGVSEAQAAETITPDALNGARPVDPAFLTLMSEHNRGALALAQAELNRGSDPAVKALAQRIATQAAGELDGLSSELAELAAKS